jgi:hypothetical protein
MSFSVGTKDSPVWSGFVCTYPECGALFLDIEECDIHTKTVHMGATAALSCASQEERTDSGHIKMTRVYEESGYVLKNEATPDFPLRMREKPRELWSLQFQLQPK